MCSCVTVCVLLPQASLYTRRCLMLSQQQRTPNRWIQQCRHTCTYPSSWCSTCLFLLWVRRVSQHSTWNTFSSVSEQWRGLYCKGARQFKRLFTPQNTTQRFTSVMDRGFSWKHSCKKLQLNSQDLIKILKLYSEYIFEVWPSELNFSLFVIFVCVF